LRLKNGITQQPTTESGSLSHRDPVNVLNGIYAAERLGMLPVQSALFYEVRDNAQVSVIFSRDPEVER